jgi:hypothetical protein
LTWIFSTNFAEHHPETKILFVALQRLKSLWSVTLGSCIEVISHIVTALYIVISRAPLITARLCVKHGRGLCGRVVKVADLRSQVPHRCRFDPHLGWNLSCEEAIQLAYGRSVVLPRCPLVPKIMPCGAPGVFLHQ